MSFERLRVAFLAMAVAGSAAAQQIWKVNCNGGPGVHFTDLPPAVAAAAPGDTILVYTDQAGCAAYYTAPTIDKPLRVLGFSTTFPPGSPEPSATAVRGLITITGISAGQQVLLSNLVMAHLAFLPSTPPSGFSITHCDGDVLIEDLLFMNGGHAGQVLRIEDCANVVLRGCEFAIGGAPIEVIDSSVLLTTTAVYHVPPQPANWNGYTQTAAALFLQNSTATLANSLAWGSDNWGWGNLNARHGAVLDQSTLNVGPWSSVRGGLITGTSFALSYSSPQPTLSTVRKDPRAVIPMIPLSGPSPQPADIHATYHSWIVADELYRVSVAGPSNGFALLVLGDWTPFPVPTPWGMLAVDPLTTMLVDLVALPAPDGYLEWTFHCPAAAPNAHGFAFQALTLSPVGQLGLTVPSPLTVGWEHGRIP